MKCDSKKPLCEKILAVEGKDECNFFSSLLEYKHINDVQIIDIGGKEKFKIALPLFVQTDGFFEIVKKIGFVRDAEEKEAQSAFQSICGILSKVHLPVPSEINKKIKDNNMETAVFIMPNNNAGMLEDLCIKTKETDEVWQCVNAFIQCYQPKIEIGSYNVSKAKILAYLSTRTPIVNSLGLAALQGVWDFDNPCFEQISLFLEDLFNA